MSSVPKTPRKLFIGQINRSFSLSHENIKQVMYKALT